MTEAIYNADGDDVTKYVKKLQGLMALATDEGNTPEAREAAQAKAFELMEKYGVDAATVAKSGTAKAEELTRSVIEVSGIYARQLQDLALVVADGVVGVRAMLSGKGRKVQVHLFGYESAVAGAQVIYASLSLQVLGQLGSGWKKAVADEPWLKHYTAMQKFVWKREFITGFAQVVHKRLKEARARSIRKAEEAGYLGTAVALVDRQTAVDTWSNQFAGGTAKQGKLGSYDNSAFGAGQTAGKSAALGVEQQVGSMGHRALT